MENQCLSTQEIGKYINQARTNPQSIIPYIETQLAKFKNNMAIEMTHNCMYNTNEGKGAWIEAISFLKSQKPLYMLQLHEGLRKAAYDHAKDLVRNNMMGHVGSDGSTMSDRITRYSNYNNGTIGQNVAQQFIDKNRNHALESIISLIIDDGVSNRGHRKSIFSSDYHYYGSSSQKGSYIITVIDYSSHNLPSKGSGNNSNSYTKENYQKQKPSYQNFSYQPQSFQNDDDDDDFNNFNKFSGYKPVVNYNQKSSGGHGQRYVVSSSTKTETKTINGKKETKTIIQKKYSDGSTQREQKIEKNY